MGHSMGGITSLAASRVHKDIKFCVAVDPWFFPVHKELWEKKFGLNIPFCCVSTEKFMSSKRKHNSFNKEFELFEPLKLTFEASKSNPLNTSFLLLKVGHAD